VKIVFTPASKEVEALVQSPISAKQVMPEWYKKSPAFDLKNPIFSDGQISNTSIKMCMPFFDATTGGYIQKTWTDIHIAVKDNAVIYHTALPPTLMSNREKVSIDINDSYYPIEYVWQRQWTARLPKGYSLLITHPHNRLDLPFTTLSGLVDSDSYYHAPIGNIPFFIKNGFQGFIPTGTPMYQMIPVKRENWESVVEPFNEIENAKLNHQVRTRFYGAYRDMFWNKKTYN
jgi:hypothetical protein